MMLMLSMPPFLYESMNDSACCLHYHPVLYQVIQNLEDVLDSLVLRLDKSLLIMDVILRLLKHDT